MRSKLVWLLSGVAVFLLFAGLVSGSGRSGSVDSAAAGDPPDAETEAAFNLAGCAGCHTIPGVPNAMGMVDGVTTNPSLVAKTGRPFKDVVKVTIWLTDFRHYAGMNEVYGSFFPKPRPPRACVKADLVWPELLVEIEAIAVIGSDTTNRSQMSY